MAIFNQSLESNQYNFFSDLKGTLIKCKSFSKTILFILKTKTVPIKLIYTPLEFFLIQEADKTLEFIEKTENYLKKHGNWHISWFANYNYFSEVYDNYFFGSYINSYSKMDFGFIEISFSICSRYLLQNDFEMAITALRNLKYSENFWPMESSLLSIINLMMTTITDVSMNNFNFDKRKMMILMKNYDFYLDFASFAIIDNFEILFKIMKKLKLAIRLLKFIFRLAKMNNKILIMCRANYGIGMIYKSKRKFYISNRYFEKTIRFKKYNDNWALKFIFLAYHNLIEIYLESTQTINNGFIEKIYKLLEKLTYESNEEKIHFYTIFGYDLNRMNKSTEALLIYKKCLGYKPTVITTNYQRYIFGILYCLRCTIDLDLGNFKYCHQSLYNAKALLEIIFPKNHPAIIDLKLLLLELKFNWSRHGEVIATYEELIQDNPEWLANLFKYSRSLIFCNIINSYIGKGQFDKALIMSLESLEWYSKNPDPFPACLFVTHINLYTIYRAKNEDSNRILHLYKALECLNNKFYEFSDMIHFITSLAKSCFVEKVYESCKSLCKSVLNKPKCEPNRHALVRCYILLARIYYIENKLDLWRKNLNKAEKVSKLTQIMQLNSFNSKDVEKEIEFWIHMNDVESWLSIGEAYSLDSKGINNGYWNKTENILLFCEKYLEHNYKEEKGVISDVYQVFIVLFFWQQRYEDAGDYCLKYINIWETNPKVMSELNGALFNLSFIYFNEMKFEKAKFFAEKSMKVFEMTEDFSDSYWALVKHFFVTCRCLNDSDTIKNHMQLIIKLRINYGKFKINCTALEEVYSYGDMLLNIIPLEDSH